MPAERRAITLLNSIKALTTRAEVKCLQTIMPWDVTRELVTKVDEVTNASYGCRPEARPISLHIKYGIISVDKPAGPSSHEVVAWVKRMMKLSHAGHGGTLETF